MRAETMRFLAERGLTMDDIIHAAELEQHRADPTNAERQARHRAKKRNGVTVTALPPPIERDHTPPVSSEPEGSSETPPAPLDGKEVRPEHVIEAWNLMADQSGVHKAKLTDDRRRKLKIFIRRHSIDDITEAIWRVPASPFLCGENDRGWRAGIDFILQPSSFTKLIEGTYDRSTH